MNKYRLGDIAEILIGGTPSRNNYSYWQQGEGGHSWVAISDLKGSKVISYTKEKITDKGTVFSNVKLIPKGNLIMSFKLSIGRCAITGKDLYTNEAIAAFLPSDNRSFEPEFLYYALPAVDFTLLTDVAVKGATLNKQKLKNIVITLPSLPIQRKIAHILSTIDGQIEKTEAIIAKYQAIKQGMLQDLFTRGIDVSTGQLRPRYEDAPELYKESALGMIPMGWEVKRLKDLCIRIVDCKNRTSPFVATSKYPVIRTSNIRNGELIWDDMKYTDEVSYDIWTERAIPEADDIIITREAPLGEIMKIPHGITPCLGQRTMLYKLDLTKLLPDFLVYFIMFPLVQSHLNSVAGGSTVKHLKVEEMKEILIFKPNLQEQERIVSLVVSQQKVISQSQETFAKLQLLKQGLMQDLLSGTVAVNA